MSNSQYLILENGSRVNISKIVQETSFDLYQTNLHYQICQKMAQATAQNTDEEKFFTNLYALKSSLARTATALSYFLNLNNEKIEKIVISQKLQDLLEPSLIKNMDCHTYLNFSPPNISFLNVAKLLIKALSHKVFRLLEKDKKPSDIIIRGWVDVSERLFHEEIDKGLLCIYPFALGGVRQIKFIRSCSKRKIRYTLSGMPYSIKKILSDINSGKPSEKIIFNAEKLANSKHAIEILKRSPLYIYTSDEFETGVFFLYRELKTFGITVVNAAHGVGQYCPYICYSHFKVLSESQSNFYKLFNDGISYDLVPQNYSTISLDSYSDCLDKQPAIVLIHQPFKESGLYAENSALHSLDTKLRDIAEKLEIPYFVKMHPNYKKSTLGSNNFEGKNIFNWDTLKTFRPIFITINSSLYFELRGKGVMLVYSAATFSPNLYFPDDFMTISPATIEFKISNLIGVKSWVHAAEKHSETRLD